MKIITTFLTMFILCFSLLYAFPTHAAVFSPERLPIGNAITVHVDGKYIASDVQPVMQNDRVFLPMRAAAESMGAYVYWDNETRCVSVQKDGNTAYFYVNNPYYYLNGKTMLSDVPPQIIHGRTMLPIRVFAEAIGADVYWNNNLMDVQITTGNPIKNPEIVPSILPYNLHPVIEKYYVQPSKLGIGSWFSVNQLSGETYYELLFIDELSDGSRQAIHIFSKDYQGDGLADFISAYQDPVSNIGSGCILHRAGMNSSFYESDGFLGKTFTYPSNDYFSYSAIGQPLYRTYRDHAYMPFANQTTVFSAL